jgi:hypothetical protein
MLQVLEDYASKWRFQVNLTKSEVVVVSSSEPLGVSVVERGLYDRVVLGSKPGPVYIYNNNNNNNNNRFYFKVFYALSA